MLVELGLVEQRDNAVCEVLDGVSVTDVARRNGVARQTVHDWLRHDASRGVAGLADRSSRPATCPHQMAPAVEARPAWMKDALCREYPGVDSSPTPSRASRPPRPFCGRCAVRDACQVYGSHTSARRVTACGVASARTTGGPCGGRGVRPGHQSSC